jgi:phosphatidylglycerol:prolipoprotein diacylglycerol transferase
VHPILFKLGPLTVHSYGVLLMIGFVAGVAWSVREGARRGLSADQIIDTSLTMLVGGIVGARLLFVLVDSKVFSSPAQWFQIWEGGLSFHGSLIGGTLALIWAARRWRLPMLPLMDSMAPSVGLGYAIGRVGCFLNGCCYGGACSLPWATRFYDPTVPGGVTPPSHPVQLYASVGGLAIFGILAWMSKRQQYNGQLALGFFLLYSVLRFFEEFFRAGVTSDIVWNGFTDVQLYSVLTALVVLGWMFAASAAHKRRSRVAVGAEGRR